MCPRTTSRSAQRTAPRAASERGAALIAALAAIALLMPLGALAVLQARSSLLLAQGLRGEAEALRAAEIGIEWAAAALPPDAQPGEVERGPDGIAGTADDGVFPFGTGPAVAASPEGYEVGIRAPAPDLLRLTAVGYGFRQAVVVLERVLVRSPTARSPAAVYATEAIAPGFGVPPFAISGFDHAPGDAFGDTGGSAAALPALALPSDSAVAAVLLGLGPGDGDRLLGAGGPPSIGREQPIDVGAAASRARAAAQAVRYAAGGVPTDLSAGTEEAPQLTIVETSAEVEGVWSGYGILVVDGLLHVRGRLRFRGVVIAANGFRVDPEGDAEILGALWLAASAIEAWGRGGIGACHACIAVADAAVPAVLPRPYLARGWIEVP